MPTKKSRTFAVFIPGAQITQDIRLLWLETKEGVKTLVLNQAHMAYQGEHSAGEAINLLVRAGITARYYDREEKQWMDYSLAGGLVRAPGSRDGQWAQPSIEEFEEHYLQTV